MIKQLTLSQLYAYIKYNMSTYIIKNTHINQIQIIYAIKIANTPIYTVFDLYSILNCINRDWTNIARDDIMVNFENYIHNEISDNDYKLLCEKLRLPESVKDDNYIFDMTYLTDFDFKPCTLEDCKLANNYIKLSNNELLDLCSIPLTDKQRKELAAL